MNSLTLQPLDLVNPSSSQSLATSGGSGVVSLWRGVLLIEPDISILKCSALMLTNSDYCVTPAFSNSELFILRNTKAVALAIISDRLGAIHLCAAATTVRRQWPGARILILGQASLILEDHLYDEQVDQLYEPQRLLAEVERLYKGLWNQRSHTLDLSAAWSAQSFARPPLSESDPTKDNKTALPGNESYLGKPSNPADHR